MREPQMLRSVRRVLSPLVPGCWRRPPRSRPLAEPQHRRDGACPLLEGQ